MIANEMDMRWIVERVVELCDPDRVFLFGSYAKGTAHNGSDVDLLIVAPSALPRPHRGKSLKFALSAFPSHFDLLFFTPQELEDEMKDPYSFISSIAASGRLVYQKAECSAVLATYHIRSLNKAIENTLPCLLHLADSPDVG